MAAGDDIQAAVFLIDLVQGQPGGDAGPRLHAQVILILVQRLTARPRRFEVVHGLYGERLAAQNACQAAVDARVDHPAQADLIAAVGLHQARVDTQWIDIWLLGQGLKFRVGRDDLALAHGFVVIVVELDFLPR